MSNKSPCMLVTTALENTWGNSENIIFLGEWCKKYERRHIFENRKHEILGFHWDDRGKLAKDYIYLENLHQLLLGSLTQALNNFHGVEYKQRYWQILLDPWLMAYVSVIFDRWESLRIAFEKNIYLKTIFLNSNIANIPPYSYEDFVSNSAYSDNWNQDIYERIISYKYLDQCSLELVDASHTPSENIIPSLDPLRFHSIRSLISISALYLNRLFKFNNVAFIGASFNKYALFKLSLRMGQFPLFNFLDKYRPFSSGRLFSLSSSDKLVRSDIEIDFHASSIFEEFLKQSIVYDIPIFLVEDYKMLQEKVSNINFSPKVIITGSSHWVDFFAKIWFAEHVLRGGKLFILEHGGSLPPYKELFNFESDISDKRISWFLPYNHKNVQMPPPKIIGKNNFFFQVNRLLTRNRYCSLIGNECARWVHRVHFYPMANQWVSSFNMTLKFYGYLDDNVKDFFRIKPYPSSQGWNTHQRFVDLLGVGKVYKEKSLSKIYSQSKVIVCSYPETTFSEAMASGVPTILMYPEHLYELHPVALPLLEILRLGNIVFNDPADAAKHINSIWANPFIWWNSSSTVFARNEFFRQALNLDFDWIKKWKELLER